MAEVLIFVLLIVAAVAAALNLLREPQSDRYAAERSAWQSAAERLRIGAVPEPGGFGLRLVGIVKDFTVAVESVDPPDSEKPPITRVSVWGPGLPAGLSATRESVLTRVRSAFGFSDVQTGDADFDARILRAGPEADVLGRLDAEHRLELLRFVARGGGRIERGRIVLEETEAVTDPQRLMDLVASATAAAQSFSLHDDKVPERLAASAVRDQIDAVRRRAVEVLVRHYPVAPETRRACATTVENRLNPADLRLTAALHLGTAGLPTLEELLRDPAVPDATRARALARLAEALPRERALPLVEFGMEAGGAMLQEEAEKCLREMRHLPETATLQRWLGARLAPTVELAIAELTARLGSALEPELRPLLTRAEASIRAAAATALGHVGTAASIEHLQSCARDASLMEANVRNAVIDALRAIRSRMDGAQGGCLSLAAEGGDAAGALSVATIDAGALSVAEARDPAPLEAAPARPRPEIRRTQENA
ncbi:MAG: HEAT repeat domain-containing protein [Planctomycetes bacterium]|nr:HEAT repeat domain-containing protein [Planctomycetota bacterium]